MKYSIKQDVVDRKGNRGTIVASSESNGRVFYQVLMDKDWMTGKADFYPEEDLFEIVHKQFRRSKVSA